MSITGLMNISRQRFRTSVDPITIATAFAFLSGFLSLGYQYFWFKTLTIAVGVDLHSSSIVIAGFFTGLGIGSIAFTRTPFKQWKYPTLELLTTVTAAIVSLLLTSYQSSTALYLWLYEQIDFGALIVFSLFFAIPAFFMGGTLIALLRHLQHIGLSEVAKTAGRVYASNLLGAALGTITAGVFMVAAFGVWKSLTLLLLGNLCLAFLGWFYTKGTRYLDESTSIQRENPHFTLVALYSLSGFTLLAFELIWFQVLNQLLLTSTLIYAVLLTLLLIGLGIGNQIGTRLSFKNEDVAFEVAALLSALAILIPVLVLSFPEFTVSPLITYQEMYQLYNSLRKSEMLNGFVQFVFEYNLQSALYRAFTTLQTSIILILPSSICFGVIFPLISQCHSNDRIASNTGLLLGFNTLFGVLATIVVSFFLVPHLGLVTSLKVVTVSGAAVLCTLLLIRHTQSPSSFLKYAIYPLLLVMVVCSQVVPDDLALRVLMNEQKFGHTQIKPTYFSEGKGYSITVLEEEIGDLSYQRLFIRGESNTGDMLPALRYMRQQAFLPYLVHKGEPKNALFIGLGTGNTSGAFTLIKSMSNIEVFELLPKMIEATRFFSRTNYDLTNNDKVRINLGDGRLRLSQSKQNYDIITLEPPPPSSAGVNNLYSVDFYRLANKRLAQDGVLAQWLPPHTQSLNGTRSIVAAVAQVFPYVTLWQTEMYEYLIIASNTPFTHVTYDSVREKLKENPRIVQSMKEIGVDGTESILASYIAGNDGIKTLVDNVEPVTDDNALLETDLIGGFEDSYKLSQEMLLAIKDEHLNFKIPTHAVERYNRARHFQKVISSPELNLDELKKFEGNLYVDWHLSVLDSYAEFVEQ